jgi:hypothetical protein
VKDILCTVERSPEAVARHHHNSQQTVARVLHDQLLYQFQALHVQALQPPLGYERRKAFCEWLLQRDAASPTFLGRALLMDEACFTRNGIFNTRNQRT